MRVIKPLGNHKLPLTKPMIGVAGKTGLWRNLRPVVSVEKCTRCYQCEIFCPVSTIEVEPETGAVVDYEYCKGCGVCADICPARSITMVPETGE
ncbi:MAG: 4Fe-4S binding protein [Desulfurococcaceae archaeon]